MRINDIYIYIYICDSSVVLMRYGCCWTNITIAVLYVCVTIVGGPMSHYQCCIYVLRLLLDLYNDSSVVLCVMVVAVPISS